MKKNILIIVLVFLTACTLIFAFIKAQEAEKEAMAAQEERNRAIECQMEAERQQELALQAAAEAKRQQQLAEEAMARFMECQNK